MLLCVHLYCSAVKIFMVCFGSTKNWIIKPNDYDDDAPLLWFNFTF